MSDELKHLNWDVDGSHSVEPPENIKENGYPEGAAPPTEHFNWVFRTIDRWNKFFEGKLNTFNEWKEKLMPLFNSLSKGSIEDHIYLTPSLHFIPAGQVVADKNGKLWRALSNITAPEGFPDGEAVGNFEEHSVKKNKELITENKNRSLNNKEQIENLTAIESLGRTRIGVNGAGDEELFVNVKRIGFMLIYNFDGSLNEVNTGILPVLIPLNFRPKYEVNCVVADSGTGFSGELLIKPNGEVSYDLRGENNKNTYTGSCTAISNKF